MPDGRIAKTKTIIALLFGAIALITHAADIPVHVRGNFGLADKLIASKHVSVPTWPEKPVQGTTLRSPKPIKTAEDFKALLGTAPKTFLGGGKFGQIAESDGWMAAPLNMGGDDTADGKSLWIHGLLVKKGSSELYYFSHW